MHRYCKFGLAIWDGKSPGTKHEIIYGNEHYAYFDGENVLIDFPSPAPGLRSYIDKLSVETFSNQYSILEKCPEATQIFES